MNEMNTEDQIDQLLEGMKSEHERLFQTVGRIRDALSAEDIRLAKQHLLVLQIFQQSHFEHESRLMDQYEYPHAKDHRSRHDTLTETLERINRLIHVEDLQQLSGKLADYLENSVIHIIEVDRPFQEFLLAAKIQDS